jgi:hypothetical protein
VGKAGVYASILTFVPEPEADSRVGARQGH